MCWGSNRQSALGRPFDMMTEFVATPVTPTGVASVEQVAVGGRHTCVRLASSIGRWGWNMFGQLGLAPGPDRITAVSVAGLSGTPTDLAMNFM